MPTQKFFSVEKERFEAMAKKLKSLREKSASYKRLQELIGSFSNRLSYLIVDFKQM